jgi:hypothetical protein
MVAEEDILVVADRVYMAAEPIALAAVGKARVADHNLLVVGHSLVVVALVVANLGLMEAAAFVSPSMTTPLLQRKDSCHGWRRIEGN